MHKIQKLDKHLMNMIAAGEVVERPAGIVKELVENSIDANATVIEVNIVNGGIDLISVLDNGDGMSSDDTLLAFERHATSKIKLESDLWSIKSLGFRGEAIPSIASVSEVSMLSNNGTDSTEVTVEYGELITNKKTALNKGTQITVKGLFHKTPARLKSFKSVNYEKAIITSNIEKFAFAYPNISFILLDDYKEIFKTSGNGDLLEIMYVVYGKDIAKNSFVFEDETDDFKVSGVLVKPRDNRANRNHIQLFVNDRMVKSYKLSQDVINGYKQFMFSDRFPIAIIKLEMDYQLVDVNVHPSKWEVRISKERQLSDFLYNAVKNALSQNMDAAPVRNLSRVEDKHDQMEFTEITKVETPRRVIDNVKPYTHENRQDYVNEEIIQPEPTVTDDIQPHSTVGNHEEVVEESVEDNVFLHLRVIGQMHGKYILAEDPESLYIIDQHAAEERSNFDKINEKLKNNVIETTQMLVPLMMDVKMSYIPILANMIMKMDSFGLKIEMFSNTSIIVREIPLWLMDKDIEIFVLNVMEYLYDNKDVSLETLRKDVIATQACHASIRFNRVLSTAEMEHVIINLSEAKQPYHCPHGRPTLIKITEKQLIKEFLR